MLVKDFRVLVHQKTGLVPELQRLIYRAKLFVDDEKISEYIKEDDQTIHLVKKETDPQQQP